jgi:hypothetical protein
VPAKTKPIPEILQELWELLLGYARQETIEPLSNLGRYLKFGFTGALLLAIGTFFLALSALRALQTQTGEAFNDGVGSSVPYLVVLVGLTVIAGLSVWRIGKAKKGQTR